nr:hypothetical protein [Tanacetum cinerariifolium]
DQDGSDPVKIHVALARLNPKPMHDDFVATVYAKVHKSLKFLTDEQVILEDPLSSSRTLSSMKILDDTYTFGDQFFNDKSTKDEPGKQNVDAEVVSMNVDAEVLSMVTVLIHQASTSVPPLSIPIIDLSPPKLVASPLPEPFPVATTKTTTTTLPLPPPPQQQSTTDSKLAARVTTLEKKFVDFEQKSQTLYNTTQNLGSRVFTLELRDLPHKINQTVNEVVKEAMFESGSYKLLPEHVALYEALEASMEWANIDEFLAEKDKSQKRLEDVPIPDDVNISDSEDTDTTHLLKIKTKPDWLKPVSEEDRSETLEPDWIIPLTDLPEVENN